MRFSASICSRLSYQHRVPSILTYYKTWAKGRVWQNTLDQLSSTLNADAGVSHLRRLGVGSDNRGDFGSRTAELAIVDVAPFCVSDRDVCHVMGCISSGTLQLALPY